MELATELPAPQMHTAVKRGDGRAVSDDFPVDTANGLTTTDLLRTTPEIIKDLNQKSFGVFHVPAAVNSPFVPAQKDFVVPYGIASVLGFGGILPDGELFAVIIFARVAIPTSTAEMSRTIALNLKLGLLAILDKPVFAG
jgi:hypothetical protein